MIILYNLPYSLSYNNIYLCYTLYIHYSLLVSLKQNNTKKNTKKKTKTIHEKLNTEQIPIYKYMRSYIVIKF